eukprot:gene14410-biopygen5113
MSQAVAWLVSRQSRTARQEDNHGASQTMVARRAEVQRQAIAPGRGGHVRVRGRSSYASERRRISGPVSLSSLRGVGGHSEGGPSGVSEGTQTGPERSWGDRATWQWHDYGPAFAANPPSCKVDPNPPSTGDSGGCQGRDDSARARARPGARVARRPER